MKSLVTICLTTFLLSCAAAVYADTYITEDIYENQHWTLAGSPYWICNYINVRNGARITVDPRVHIKFLNSTALYFREGSKISAIGTAGNEICIYYEYAPDPNQGWLISYSDYIDIVDPPVYDLDFRYCDFWYMRGIRIEGNGLMRIRDCTLFAISGIEDARGTLYPHRGVSRFVNSSFSGYIDDTTHLDIRSAEVVNNCTFNEFAYLSYTATGAPFTPGTSLIQGCVFENSALSLDGSTTSGPGLITRFNQFRDNEDGCGVWGICYP